MHYNRHLGIYNEERCFRHFMKAFKVAEMFGEVSKFVISNEYLANLLVQVEYIVSKEVSRDLK